MLKGVLPVLHTPYDENFEIDYAVLEAEIGFAYECGADGIVMALVTELFRLSETERRAMAEFLVRCSDGRGTVTISVGAETLRGALAYALHAEAAGATAVMAIPPLSTALGEDELKRYYGAIVNAVGIPVVVQDASSYVGKPMSAAFQVSLWREFGKRVLFKPESVPVGPVITAMNALSEGKVTIMEGSGGSQLTENFRRGISGTMPGVDLLDAIVTLWNALRAGDDERIYAISPLVGAILALASGLDGYLAIEKHLMVRRGIFKKELVRGPVGFRLDAHALAEVDRLFDRLQTLLK